MYAKEDILYKCGICGKPFKLVPGKHSLYYRCPNYELMERGAGNKVCMNRISLKNEDTLYHELYEMERNGTLEEGKQGKKVNLIYEIEEKEEDYLSVFVINTFKIKLEGTRI